jgi:hypothetical protein
MNNNAVSSAAIFTADRAPYMKYLSANNHGEARTLEHDLRTKAALVKQSKASPSERKPYAHTIVELRDIEVHTGGKVLTCTTLMDEGLKVPKPDTVARFLNQLDDCRSTIHTRIIILHGDRISVDGQAADGLLFCHILGIILDLSPVDVRFLAQLNTPTYYDEKQLQRVSMKPGFVSLGESTHGKKRGVAAYVGTRRLGNHSPHVGESIPG